MFDKTKLRFLMIPTRFPAKENLVDYLKAYTCWKEVWTAEMDASGNLYSDNFTKASYVAVIFYDNEVACLTTLNYLDLTNQAVLDDSYFKVWPDFTQKKLKKVAKKIMVSGNLSLNFTFRRGAMGINWKDLMFAFQVKHLKCTSDYDAIVAAVRIEKGMGRAAYRTGAYSFAKDVPYTIPGRLVDLVCWHRDLDEEVMDSNLYGLVNYVWNNSWEVNHAA